MTTTFTSFANQWTDVVSYGLVDYLYDMLLSGPMASAGTLGAYAGQGVQFALKVAVSQTHPLSMIGNLMKS